MHDRHHAVWRSSCQCYRRPPGSRFAQATLKTTGLEVGSEGRTVQVDSVFSIPARHRTFDCFPFLGPRLTFEFPLLTVRTTLVAPAAGPPRLCRRTCVPDQQYVGLSMIKIHNFIYLCSLRPCYAPTSGYAGY